MRALFVDDEPRVLDALERVLFEVASDWETRFVTSADAALVELSKHSYDVIVSELRLRGMSGTALLKRVAELYPRTLRVVLASRADDEAALKVVHIAHQFLVKPCAAETLHQVISRAAELTRLLPDRRLQTLVGQAGTLPCAGHLQRDLLELVEHPHASASATAMARLIKQDPGMTCKLLQVAGSAFFNSSSSVTDVETAIMRLGVRTVRELVRSFAAPSASISTLPAISAVQIAQQRSLRIAKLAARMTRLPEDAATAYLAGLLCDVGQLVLIHTAPERVYLSQSEAAQRGLPVPEAELATWGVTHAEIGAYLLGLWGLPFQVVEAVAHHHAPERHADDRAGLTQLIWLASCLVDGLEAPAELLSRFGVEALYASQRLSFHDSQT
jgi:HD-like signal output (HDOD) protein/CheY-like chemotaxis protein